MKQDRVIEFPRPRNVSDSWLLAAVVGLQPKAKSAPHETWMADTKAKAQAAFARFVAGFTAKCPKAVECPLPHPEPSLAFYDFAAERGMHIHSTNVTESAFAAIRCRSNRTKGCARSDSMLSMVFKLGVFLAGRIDNFKSFGART